MPGGVATLVLLFVVFATAAAAAAKPKPITGKLPYSGLTVVALDAKGRSTSAVARPSFRLTPPAQRVTLHLVDARGHYLGPVVAAAKGRTAVVGLRAGAKLGKLRLRAGVARPARPLARVYTDRKRTARATRKGVPLGAGRLGKVRGSAKGRAGRGLDVDRDGIPGVYDVDDDGDLLLDNVDVGARAAIHDADEPFHPFWVMSVGLPLTFMAERDGLATGVAGYALNRNARNTAADNTAFDRNIKLAMRASGILAFPIPAAGAVLDCHLLVYCLKARDLIDRNAFADPSTGSGPMTPAGSFSPQRDGIGPIRGLDPSKVSAMRPNAEPSEIGAGDRFVERSPGAADTEVMLNMVVGTVPALQSFADGTGSGATVSYPVPVGGPGEGSNPIGVKPGPDGDYRLTLTVWRPQRQRYRRRRGRGERLDGHREASPTRWRGA